MKLFSRRKILDEREELEMYRSEHKMFWFMFWVLVIGTLAQKFILHAPLGQYAWEGILLLVVSIWSLVVDFRHGIYDTVSRPGWRSYLGYALVFSIVFTAIIVYSGWSKGWLTTPREIGIAALVEWMFFFLLMYAALAVWGTLTQYRRKKLERQFQDEEP